jgi:hypothetical protein
VQGVDAQGQQADPAEGPAPGMVGAGFAQRVIAVADLVVGLVDHTQRAGGVGGPGLRPDTAPVGYDDWAVQIRFFPRGD